VPAMSGFRTLAGLVTAGPLARTVADAALLLDALVGDGRGWATGPPTWDGGAFLNAATRGEGRFSIAVTRGTPWSASVELTLDPDADAALDLAIRELSAIGHGIDEFEIPGDPAYAPAFRTVWQSGAAAIDLDAQQFALVEPLSRWLIEEGRRRTAAELGTALYVLAAFERSTIERFAPFDVVLTPALALTPRPLGWYDPDDGDRNFAQQVQYTPYTSFVNVAGLPAIALPVHETADGLPMGVQLIGRPGGERTPLAIGAQPERRIGWQRRHPPQW